MLESLGGGVRSLCWTLWGSEVSVTCVEVFGGVRSLSLVLKSLGE